MHMAEVNLGVFHPHDMLPFIMSCDCMTSAKFHCYLSGSLHSINHRTVRHDLFGCPAVNKSDVIVSSLTISNSSSPFIPRVNMTTRCY